MIIEGASFRTVQLGHEVNPGSANSYIVIISILIFLLLGIFYRSRNKST